jgi:hypothetical protein
VQEPVSEPKKPLFGDDSEEEKPELKAESGSQELNSDVIPHKEECQPA